MHDIRLIREDLKRFEAGLKAKNVSVDLNKILAVDQKRRDIIKELDDLRAKTNTTNEKISLVIRSNQDATAIISSMKDTSVQISKLDPQLKNLDNQIYDLLIGIPNLPHSSVPVGSPQSNKVVRTWGKPPKFDFKPKDHIALAESLDIIDFKRAAKLSGSNFVLYKGLGARLERALLNFMLDLHTKEHGFTEVMPPILANTATMTATGQLPKMKDDMYHLAEDDLYLIPTAEVPVTNIFRDEILNEEDLPVYLTAYTPCFRREAGSYGKDTRGLVRVHQFNKVELVKFVRPETSYDELESLVKAAEKVLQLLELPYRVLMLASGDLSFAASKCYDLEAYAAGLDKWLEVSSCSNFEDFQARRGNIRFKGKDQKKPALIHTLNGSGLALARTVIAILENYQTSDGRVTVPKVLLPYMGGAEVIGPEK